METIEQLLKQAETQHKVIELNAMFTKNMAFFQQAMPDIYERFKNYQVSEIQLIITENGWVDLVNINLNNQPVYGRDPIEFAQETVAGFIKNPSAQRFNPEITEVIDVESESHTPNINAIIHSLNEKNTDQSRAALGSRTEFLFMLGVGLGYQIIELLKYTDIQHLVIAETNVDIFFASLYTLDWQALSEHFSDEKKTINLILGQPPETFIQMVSHHVQKIGVFNIAKPYIYTHLSSKELVNATTTFLQNLPIVIGALGYFDDEKTSLTHSINNFKNKIPFMKSHGFLLKQFERKPVFLMGNGPSLDMAKDFITAHQDKAILVSCGSALSSLAKLGIKPDFHVELERTYPIKEWIETTTTPEFRQGIKLLAVNTVHPDLPKLFDLTGMALKYNDLGATYLDQYISDDEMSVTLGSCNPTVSNCGLSFCAALGFVDVYLFGIDLGYPDGGKHHSQHSFHYDIKDEDIDSFNLDSAEENSNFLLPGNFGGKIISSPLFFRSKLALEAILKDCKELKCHNTSNGIAIEKATPIKLDDIDTHHWQKLNKNQYTSKLFKKYFTSSNFLPIPDNVSIINSFSPTVKTLDDTYNVFEKDIKTIEEGIVLLQKNEEIIQHFSLEKETRRLGQLLKGSSDAFSLMLALCLNANNGKDGVVMFNEAKEHYRKYLKGAQNVIRNNLLENDTKRFNIKEKLK